VQREELPKTKIVVGHGPGGGGGGRGGGGGGGFGPSFGGCALFLAFCIEIFELRVTDDIKGCFPNKFNH
jgi:hypothetical protein